MTVGFSLPKNSFNLLISSATSINPCNPCAASRRNSEGGDPGGKYLSTYILTVAP